MKTILKNNLAILVLYAILLIAALSTIILNSKAETHLFFNSFHNPFFDSFFYCITFLGDGVAAILIAIILLVVKYRFVFIVALSSIISALITHSLKYTFDIVRPKKFFEDLHDLYFVPGVENYLYNSFPSGHTTCAFSLYFALAFIVKQQRLKMLFLVLAVLTGYSRIYLSQHFLEDVTAGSVIGSITAFFVYFFISSRENEWMDKSLIDSFKKSQ